MANAPICDFGWSAVDFDLPATDGKRYVLSDVKGPKGLLVMFICNHCPYVKAVIDRIVRDCSELKQQGIGCVAINANDAKNYPEDSFENMKRVAQDLRFSFPYLWDESQQVARAYLGYCQQTTPLARVAQVCAPPALISTKAWPPSPRSARRVSLRLTTLSLPARSARACLRAS